MWYASNYGIAVDIAAPGENIWSTYWSSDLPPLTYTTLSGTSMAVPHVSALAALLLSLRPDYSPADLRAVIQQTAIDVGDPGIDDFFGYGRIEADAAVAFANPYRQRVNAGGVDYIDGAGREWTGDRFFANGSWGATGGTIMSSFTAVNGTNDDALYQAWRGIPANIASPYPRVTTWLH